ncbi:hypothetical protein [Ornithinimicrobium kibberense]|uniref:hypothetical protein n=1 Tax=Ornithinimicrobium kibberense TaxID=282060 RepID=UPI00361420DF
MDAGRARACGRRRRGPAEAGARSTGAEPDGAGRGPERVALPPRHPPDRVAARRAPRPVVRAPRTRRGSQERVNCVLDAGDVRGRYVGPAWDAGTTDERWSGWSRVGDGSGRSARTRWSSPTWRGRRWRARR